MKKTKLLFTLITALVFGAKTFAQTSFTIDEAVDYALKNHNTIKNAQVGIQDAELQIKEIKYAGMPQINAQFSYTYNAIVPSQLIDAKNFNPDAAEGEVVKFKFGVPWGGQAGIGLNQLIFDATWLVGLRAADTYRKMPSQEVDKSKLTVAENVKKAYYSVLVAEQRAILLNLNLARMDSMIFQTDQLYKQGFVEKIDLDRLTVQRNNFLTEKQKVQNLISFTYQLLKFQMSYPVNSTIKLEEKLNVDDVKILRGIRTEEVDLKNRIEFIIL